MEIRPSILGKNYDDIWINIFAAFTPIVINKDAVINCVNYRFRTFIFNVFLNISNR